MPFPLVWIWSTSHMIRRQIIKMVVTRETTISLVYYHISRYAVKNLSHRLASDVLCAGTVMQWWLLVTGWHCPLPLPCVSVYDCKSVGLEMEAAPPPILLSPLHLCFCIPLTSSRKHRGRIQSAVPRKKGSVGVTGGLDLAPWDVRLDGKKHLPIHPDIWQIIPMWRPKGTEWLQLEGVSWR